MKRIILIALFCSPFFLEAQIGIKAGPNFARVSKASQINSANRTGFHAGIFLAPPSQSILSSRTELLFSRQGYDFKTGTTTGDVQLDYIMLPQLLSINITKYFSLQLGAQMAFLISAEVDSSTAATGPERDIMDLYNKFDYGYAVGAEGHPIKNLMVGVRYNVSLGKVYKSAQAGQMPTFTAEDAKNNVVQLFVGWRFGK